jgi:hypothetical protein
MAMPSASAAAGLTAPLCQTVSVCVYQEDGWKLEAGGMDRWMDMVFLKQARDLGCLFIGDAAV